MAEHTRLKAVLKLLKTDTGKYAPILKDELVHAIQQNPSVVHQVITDELKSTPSISVLNTLEEIFWEDLTKELISYKKNSTSLKEGLLLLSKFTDPACNSIKTSYDLNKYTKTLQAPIFTATSIVDIVRFLQRNISALFTIANTQEKHNLKLFSFARLLRKKEASSLVITCLYKIVAEEYNLPFQIINLAGKFLVSIGTTSNNKLFISPLDSNKILTLVDCHADVTLRKIAWKERFLSPLSTQTILRYLLSQMIYVANKTQDLRATKYLRKYMEII